MSCFKHYGLGLLWAGALFICGNGSASAQSSCIVWADFRSHAQTQMYLQGAPSESEVELKAKLIYRPLISEAGSDWLGFQLFNSENYVDQKPVNDGVYSVPFAVKVNRKTKLDEAFIFNAPLKLEDQEKLKNIYKRFRILPPKKGDSAKNYQVSEQDDLGEFLAEYAYQSPVKGTKRKVSYTTIGWADKKTVFAELKDVIVHHDTLAFEEDACWLSQAEGDSDTEIVTQDQFLHLRVAQKNTIKRRKDSPHPDARLLQLGADPNQWEMLSAATVYPPATPNPMSSAQKFLQTLTAVELDSLSHKALEQLLYDNQMYLHLLKDPLLKDVFSNASQARLILVLGLVDIPPAHSLLTDIYLDEEFDYEARFRTLMALKYAERPLDEKLVDAIFEYANKEQAGSNAELSHSSMMVMGIISRTQNQSEFGRQLSDRLALELKTPRAEAGQAALLTALGNAGDTAHQEIISHFLNSESSTLRARSAEALFHMPNPAALNSLSRSLVKEENSKTRKAILRSMGPNKFSEAEVTLVMGYAQNSAESETRRAAISALVRQRDHDVDVKPQLKRLIKHEKNEANLRDLMKALYSKNKQK